MMFDLSGKNALITGATGGIGNSIAEELHKAGAKLAISGTRKERLLELSQSLGKHCHVLPCDLKNPDAVDQLFSQAENALGNPPDILVSNAGITRDSLLIRMKDEDWKNVININLEAFFRLCRAALKPMMKQRYGRIIGISSIIASTGNPGQCNYAASKAGMIGFSKALAQEVASRNITVNCIAPGFIHSPMTDTLPQSQKDAILAAIPAKRLGEGKDIAAAVQYLASNAANYITGQTLHVNGGLSMF